MVGGTQVPPPDPITRWARPAERAGLGGAVARWAEGGGGQRRGRPPPPFSLPATAAANHQAGARPRRGLLWPRNSQTPSFRGKKIRAAGSAAGSGGRPGARDRTHVRAGSQPHTRFLCHPQKGRRTIRRVDRERSGGLRCQPGPGRGGAGGRAGLCAPGSLTLQNFPGLSASTGARVPRARAALHAVSGSAPSPAGP